MAADAAGGDAASGDAILRADAGPDGTGRGEAALRAALCAAQDHLGPASDATPWRLPAAVHLALHARRAGRAVPADQPAAMADPGFSPATLGVEAERLGFRTERIVVAAGRVSAGETPCLLALSDGGAALVLAIDGSDALLATAGGPVRCARAFLARRSTGEALRLTPRPEPALMGRDTAETDPAPPGTARAPASLTGVLRAALAAQRSLIVPLVVASVLINLMGLLLPLFSMAVFDRVIPHAAFETLWALALGVVLALTLELALRHARLKLFDAVALGIGQDLQSRLFGRLVGSPLPYLPRQASSVIQPIGDLDAASHLAPQLVVSLLVDVPFFVVMALLLAHLAGPVVAAPVLGALALVLLHAAGHAMARRAQLRQGSLARRHQQLLIDAVEAGERLRITGAARPWLRRWDMTADEACAPGHAARYWAGLTAQGSAIIVQGVTVATIIIGVYRIDQAAMTIGALSAAILLVSRAMAPIATATALGFRMVQTLRQAMSIAPLLDAPLETASDPSAAAGAAIRGEIAARALSFTYPGETQPVLRGLDFTIRPGERVGLIGRAGCGKSTLLRLILRLHDAEAGGLMLDGHDIRQRDPDTLRRAISYLPQDTHLIDGTIETNLTLGLSEGAIDRDRMREIVRLCGVEAFASQHPAGYGLPVGPGGKRLSGGERQAVALARALIQPARFYLLDEPTAAFDTNAENQLVRDLAARLGEAGLIVATHRLPLLALVDRIIWLDGGRIVADGPKAEIFARLGLPQAA